MVTLEALSQIAADCNDSMYAHDLRRALRVIVETVLEGRCDVRIDSVADRVDVASLDVVDPLLKAGFIVELCPVSSASSWMHVKWGAIKAPERRRLL
jgi:hypothetical protein